MMEEEGLVRQSLGRHLAKWNEGNPVAAGPGGLFSIICSFNASIGTVNWTCQQSSYVVYIQCINLSCGHSCTAFPSKKKTFRNPS